MNALAQYALAVASGASVVLLGFIANMLRRAIRDHNGEHKRLTETTRQHGEAIEMLLREHRRGRRGRRLGNW